MCLRINSSLTLNDLDLQMLNILQGKVQHWDLTWRESPSLLPFEIWFLEWIVLDMTIWSDKYFMRFHFSLLIGDLKKTIIIDDCSLWDVRLDWQLSLSKLRMCYPCLDASSYFGMGDFRNLKGGGENEISLCNFVSL